MKTSYFTNILNLEKPLSISRFPPKWYTGPQLKLLAPSESLLKAALLGLPKVEYRARFKAEVLDQLDPAEVYEAILAEHGDVTLLCYETLKKPEDYCHRRMVAEWFETNLEIEVPEWTPEEKLPDHFKW